MLPPKKHLQQLREGIERLLRFDHPVEDRLLLETLLKIKELEAASESGDQNISIHPEKRMGHVVRKIRRKGE